MTMFALGTVFGALMGIFITALCTISAVDEARQQCMEMIRGDPDGS